MKPSCMHLLLFHFYYETINHQECKIALGRGERVEPGIGELLLSEAYCHTFQDSNTMVKVGLTIVVSPTLDSRTIQDLFFSCRRSLMTVCKKKKKWKGEWMLQGPGVSPGNSFNVVGQRVRQILVKLLLWRINKSTFHYEEKKHIMTIFALHQHASKINCRNPRLRPRARWHSLVWNSFQQPVWEKLWLYPGTRWLLKN